MAQAMKPAKTGMSVIYFALRRAWTYCTVQTKFRRSWQQALIARDFNDIVRSTHPFSKQRNEHDRSCHRICPSRVAALRPLAKISLKWSMIEGSLSILEKFQLVRDLGFDGVELDSPNDLPSREVLDARGRTGVAIPGRQRDALEEPAHRRRSGGPPVSAWDSMISA